MIFRGAVAPTALLIGFFYFAASGCSGGSGDRSATIVAGNVRSASATAAVERAPTLRRIVARWWSARAEAQVPGVTVAILNSSTNARTDSQGFFRLEGREFGPVLLQFTGPGITATLAITLPAGGEVDLINVDLEGGSVSFDEQRIRFDGPVTGVDCQANLLQVLSGAQVPYRVRILPTTALFDQDGRPLLCDDLVAGRTADVQGTVDDSGVVDAASIRANTGPGPTPTPASFAGTIIRKACPANVSVSRDQGNVEVDINSSTEIREQSGEPLQCSDLENGDNVRVEGDETSFGVNATLIERLPPPTPSASPTPTPAP